MKTRALVSGLAFFLGLSLAGCVPGAQEIDLTANAPQGLYGPLDFKVGIMTGTVSQGEDEYRGAERVIKKYGRERIIHKTYPDNFMTEQETTVTQLVEMASDPQVKAIIVAQAIPGTLPAIKKIRRRRQDILFILVAPQEDPEQIAQYADLAIQTDDLLRGKTIVEMAKKMGAKQFLHYTFPRHMSMEILSRRRDLMRKTCEIEGLGFVSLNAPDPTGDQGIAGSQKFILEDVPRQVKERGKDIALFSTNCSMQEPLIRAALDEGAIYPEQCCPSPTHGYPGALGISITEEEAGDMSKIRGQISKKIGEKKLTGRFGTWLVSMHIVLIEGGVELAIGHVHGELDVKDRAVVKETLEKVGDAKVEISLFNEHPNFQMVISQNVPL